VEPKEPQLIALQGSIIRKAKSGPAKPKRSPLFPQRRSVVENPFNQALKSRLSLRRRKLEAFKLKNILGEVTQTKASPPCRNAFRSPQVRVIEKAGTGG